MDYLASERIAARDNTKRLLGKLYKSRNRSQRKLARLKHALTDLVYASQLSCISAAPKVGSEKRHRERLLRKERAVEV